MNTNISQELSQHGIFKSAVYHILPGLAATLVFVLLKPAVVSLGFPPLLAFLLAVLIADLPVMFIIMYLEGKRILAGYLAVFCMVLLAVIVLRALGGWKWHETPKPTA